MTQSIEFKPYSGSSDHVANAGSDPLNSNPWASSKSPSGNVPARSTSRSSAPHARSKSPSIVSQARSASSSAASQTPSSSPDTFSNSAPQGPMKQQPRPPLTGAPCYNALDALSTKLKKTVGPGAINGIMWGTLAAVGLTAAFGFSMSFAGVAAHIVPGLGIGLFIGIFVGCILIGAAAQWNARRGLKNNPEVKKEVEKIEAQLSEIEKGLLSIDPRVITATDKLNIKTVQALKTKLSWTPKQCLRQVGYGMFGIELYPPVESFFSAQSKKMMGVIERGKSMLPSFPAHRPKVIV